jgi:glutamate-1-semialdehyde 2,1-aminomutase
LFILDEMVTGFRAAFPGDYMAFGLEPDITTWGKGIGNGFSFCALAGRADVMDLGGLKQTASPRVFLLSTTHGGEAHVLAAARAVIKEYREKDVIGRHHAITAALTDGMRRRIAEHRLDTTVTLLVVPWRIIVICRDRDGNPSPRLRTLFLQEMIGNGALCQGIFLPCYSHTDDDIAVILDAFDKACDVYAYALDQGVDGLLVGEPTRPVFRKYNGCRDVCPADPCPHEAECRRSR